jgi:glucose uptake protein GlcU
MKRFLMTFSAVALLAVGIAHKVLQDKKRKKQEKSSILEVYRKNGFL